LVLATLTARALLPAGLFASGNAMATQSPMCSSQNDRLERIELPGEHSRHCFEHCFPPLLGPPIAVLRFDAPVTGATLIARAPPHA
jgi:hypothetical protein